MTVLNLGFEGCYFFAQFAVFGSKAVNVGLVADAVTGKRLLDYL